MESFSNFGRKINMDTPKPTDLSPKTRPRATPATAPSSPDAILGVLYKSVSEVNLQLPKHQRIEQSPSTILSGEGGKLDSLGLANFIVTTEQKLEDAFGVRVDLTEDDPFSGDAGHFHTLHSLATYLYTLIKGSPEAAAQ